jgi:DNA polymerase family A
MINSTPVYCLMHHTPPVGLGTAPILLCACPDGTVERRTLAQLSQSELPIVTHSFSLLVEWFRSQSVPLPKTIVDLETAKKLIVGRAKSDFGSEVPWDMASMLTDLIPPGFDRNQVRAALSTHMAKPSPSDFSSLRFMKVMTTKLPQLWRHIRTELTERGEFERFERIEVPVYNAMLEVQYRGVSINNEAREAFLKSIEDEHIAAHHNLAIRKGIDVDRALVDIEYLISLIDTPLRDCEVFNQPRDIIAARKNSDRICSLLHTVQTTSANKRILLRTGVESGRCFPLFDTLGTVTGRILAVDPHLQYIGKRYRAIIAARTEARLVYLDYAQFEPSIMASISKDPTLYELCLDDDLYGRLSSNLCGSVRYRDAVKTMFLAYSYGKDINSLQDFLVECQMSSEEATDVIAKRFAPIFSGIEKWKRSIEADLLHHGRIGTLFGNHRYRDVDGELSARERRWAVSQLVQGTGALILKKVIIALKNTLPEVSILLPMHDALLVEAPTRCVAEFTTEMITCFRQSFTEICPAISPAIKVKQFTEQMLN